MPRDGTGSFENEDIAKLMNEYFVNIKVDREERPDVDRIYMTALQSMTGAGGWPMSMFFYSRTETIFTGQLIFLQKQNTDVRI